MVDSVPILGFYQTKNNQNSNTAGRIIVYGDSNCIDNGHNVKGKGFVNTIRNSYFFFRILSVDEISLFVLQVILTILFFHFLRIFIMWILDSLTGRKFPNLNLNIYIYLFFFLTTGSQSGNMPRFVCWSFAHFIPL